MQNKVLINGLLLAGLVLGAAIPAYAADSDVDSYSKQFIKTHGPAILSDFREFLSLPNTGARRGQQQANAEWITKYIGKRGFDSKIVRAGGAPYVLAEKRVEGASKTILFYAHFDGQPVIPDNWVSPPFEPQLRKGPVSATTLPLRWPEAGSKIDPDWRIFARSAGDDKAPIIALMSALDAMQDAGVEPSVNIKLILDGEEEKGSPSLEGILQDHAAYLESDLVLFCDGPMHQSRERQLIYGVRGSMTLEVEAFGPLRPLHSGHYGNWAPNPTEFLMDALRSLKNPDGSIAVAGFYDDVYKIKPAEREAIKKIPSVETQLKRELGIAVSEQPGKRIEELVMEPAIVVKGFQAGGVENKSRNIIQPSAKASLNFRLVKNQTPEGVRKSIEAHFKKLGFEVVRRAPALNVRLENARVLKLDWRPGAYGAFKTPIDSPESDRLVAILNEIDGRETLRTPTMGGSLPIYHFERALDAPIILLPIANHDNNQHGRNENIRIGNLWDGIGIFANVLQHYGQ